SILSMPAIVGPVFGPILGGAIVTFFDWRWIFFINLPIAAVGVMLVRAYVPDVKEAEPPPLDWPGFGLSFVGLGCVVCAFATMGRALLPLWGVAGLGVAAATFLSLYWAYARSNPHAIIDISMFRMPTFRASVVGGGFVRISNGAYPYLLALLLQVGFGMSAFA